MTDFNEIQVAVIEDNRGDFFLIEEYLIEVFERPDVWQFETFRSASETLADAEQFDVILLDLSLPDADGEKLVNDIINLAGSIPVVVLTGYTDKRFGVKTLSMGVSDYLLKDELNAEQLKRSIIYSIERKRINSKLEASEKQYKNLFDLNPLPVWVQDKQSFRILDVNQAAVDHYGYTKEEFLGMAIFNIVVSTNDRNRLAKGLTDQTGVQTNTVISEHKKKNGDVIDVQSRVSNIEFKGKPAQLVISDDITEKLKFAEELKQSEQRFRALVQEGSDLISIVDRNANFKYVAPTSESVLGIPAEEFIGRNALEYIHEDDQDRILKLLADLPQEKSFNISTYRFRDSNNNWRWLETTVTNMTEHPVVGGFVANSRDITDRIESENELKKLSLVASRTTDIVIITDPDEKITWVNTAFEELTGYSMDEALGRIPGDFLQGEGTDQETVRRIKEAIEDRESVEEVILNFAKDGKKYWLEMNIDPIFNEEGECTHFIAIERDVTDRKREEERLKLLESVITSTSESVVILEAEATTLPGRKIIYVNEAFTEMTGYSSEESVGKTLLFLYGPKTDKKERMELRKSMNNWEPVNAEIISYKKNGKEMWVNLSNFPVADKNGKYTHWISIGRDVTVRRNQEDEIRKSLNEKEILLAEIHHRVKNNLAVISAMLQLQAAQYDNAELTKRLFDSIGRIKAIANIHEHLYKSQSFSDLNFSDNIKELVSMIKETYMQQGSVEIHYRCDDVFLNVNQAIPCSLILNEVVTNSLKHAFNDKTGGKIFVDIKLQDDTVTLAIDDDGSGIPDDVPDNLEDQSLGMKIIAVLSQQLKADYSYKKKESGTGTRFQISFVKANIKGIGSSHLQMT